MLGDALLFTPVLKAGDAIKNTTTINIYVPAKNTFFDFSTGVIAASGYSQLTVPFNSTVPMFIREG